MPFYTTPLVSDPRLGRVPDLPAGTDFVGELGSDGKMLLLTPTTLPAKTGRLGGLTRAGAETEAVKMGINPANLALWRIG